MPAVTLREASRRYHDFYVPMFKILVSGAALEGSVVRDVVQVTYNDSVTEIDSFDMTVNNWDPVKRQFKYVGSEQKARIAGATAEERLQLLFEPYAHDFELRLGYAPDPATIMRGSPTSLEPAFPAAGAPTLTVRALNALHRLRTKTYRTNWTERGAKRISAVIEELGQAKERDGSSRFPMPIRIDRSAMTAEPAEESITQENQYDIDFLLMQARRVGYVVYLDQEPTGAGKTRDVLRFAPSTADHPGVPAVTYELERGLSLMEFSPKLSVANQVKSVEVRSWDRQANRKIRGKSDVSDKALGVNSDLLHLLERTGKQSRETVVVNEPQHTEAEAKQRARALLSERLKQMVEATGTTIGLPDLRAGQRVRITGIGARFSGVYFLTKTTHTINDSGYVTKFTARREAGLKGARS